jgi:hypothetical protein
LILSPVAAEKSSEEASVFTTNEVVISATRTLLIKGGIRA